MFVANVKKRCPETRTFSKRRQKQTEDLLEGQRRVVGSSVNMFLFPEYTNCSSGHGGGPRDSVCSCDGGTSTSTGGTSTGTSRDNGRSSSNYL